MSNDATADDAPTGGTPQGPQEPKPSNIPGFQAPGQQPSAVNSPSAQFWGEQPGQPNQQPPGQPGPGQPGPTGQQSNWSAPAPQQNPYGPQSGYGQPGQPGRPGQPGTGPRPAAAPPPYGQQAPYGSYGYSQQSTGPGFNGPSARPGYQNQPPAGPGGYGPAAGGSGNKMPLIIGGVAVVVIIALVAVFMLFRNRDSGPGPNPGVTTPPSGEVITREFGDPAAAVGSTVELHGYDGKLAVNVDQVEWVENDGYGSVEDFKYLAIHVNLNCLEGQYDFSASQAFFIGADSGIYESSYSSLDNYQPELNNATLQKGNSFSGWLTVEAPEQAGTLLIISDDNDYPSVRFAIDGPDPQDLRSMPNSLDVTYDDEGYQLKLTGYELTDDGEEWERPAPGWKLLVLKTEFVAGSEPKAGQIYSWGIRAYQNDAETDTSYINEKIYPIMPSSLHIENGDHFSGFLLRWVDPSQPIKITYEPSTSFDEVELVTIQP